MDKNITMLTWALAQCMAALMVSIFCILEWHIAWWIAVVVWVVLFIRWLVAFIGVVRNN